MRHSEIIKGINTIFLNEWETFIAGKWTGNVLLDSTQEVQDKSPYISLDYTPFYSSQRYIGQGEFHINGSLRVHYYEVNKTKSMEILDLILEFLKNSRINNLRFEEEIGLGSPYRDSAGDLFSGFVDFKVCLVH